MSSVTFPQHYLDLTKNINDFDFSPSHLPSVINLHGADAFPVCVYNKDTVVVAAALYGKGRVVLVGHEAFLRESAWMPFISNAISWCTSKSLSKLPVGSDTVYVPNVKSIDCSRKSLVDNEGNLQCSVFFTTSYSKKSANAIVDFVRNGGGLVCGGHAWWWQQTNNKKAVIDYPGNLFLNQFGFCLSGRSFDAHEKISVTSSYSTDYQLYTLNITYLLNFIIDQAKSGTIEPSQLEDWLCRLLNTPRMQEILTGQPDFRLESFKKVWDLILVALVALGAVTNKQNFENLNYILLSYLLNSTFHLTSVKPGDVFAKHSASKKFPGDLVDKNIEIKNGSFCHDLYKPVYKKDVIIDGSYQGYPHQFQASQSQKAIMRSTGLYAPAGAVISFVFDFRSPVIGSDIFIRIGCHTDLLSNDTRRYRSITHDFRIFSSYVRAVNPFGGLIYICVPPKSNLGVFQVTITGGVTCPYYILDQTSLSDWQNMLKSSVAPWGELEIPGLLIFSLPRNDLLKLDDPVSILQLWKSIMLGVNDLIGFGNTRPRPERVVFDVAISAGSLHSGYPIMAHIGASSQRALSVQTIMTSGDWGLLHELGHNHQWASSELPGTVDTTCNLFSLFVSDHVLGLKRHQAHGAVSKSSRIITMKGYLDFGAKIENWNMWTALTTYMDLIDVFGWEPFKRLNKQYKDMEEVPESKRSDKYIELFSQEVNKNLAPYFKSWGFTISEEVEKKLSSLPIFDRTLLKAIESLK